MTEASAARLREQYAPDGGASAVFSAKVAHYAASRPAYPGTLFERLAALGALPSNADVADIGAGTGLLTRGLLERGHRVVAVEPSGEMRAEADAVLGGFAGYRSVAGTAEATTLAPQSVDLVTAAQAFHWFDIPLARREFARILRPAGHAALIWNDRLREDPLHHALEAVFDEFGGAKRDALLDHEDLSRVPQFFGAAATRTIELPNEQRLDAAGLVSLVLSRSYMPERDSAAGEAVRERVEAVFAQHAQAGEVVVRYRTLAIVGRLA
ncbi:MAG TPA: class I SAM-dependent methyltransferase [Albitalea sp.]